MTVPNQSVIDLTNQTQFQMMSMKQTQIKGEHQQWQRYDTPPINEELLYQRVPPCAKERLNFHCLSLHALRLT